MVEFVKKTLATKDCTLDATYSELYDGTNPYLKIGGIKEPKKALSTAYKEVGPVVLNQKTQKNKDLSVAPSSKPSNNEQLEGED